MSNFIETKTQDGTTIRIEIDPALKGVGFGRTTSEEAPDLNNAYADALTTVKACAGDFATTLAALENPPDSASLGFAVKIDGGSGVLIAKSGESAHFRVSLNWKAEEKDDEADD